MMIVGASFCIYLVLFQDRNNLLNAADHVFVYILVFHSLSNLPLLKAMPFEVHRRFWMQPNIILCVWSGIGITYMINVAKKGIALFCTFCKPKMPYPCNILCSVCICC